MKLKVFDETASDGYGLETKEFLVPSYFRKLVTKEIPGFVEINISCRENLYWKFTDILFVERLLGNNANLIKGFQIAERRSITNTKNLLEKTVFNKNFWVDKEGFILSRRMIAPQIFSLLALVFRDFSNVKDVEEIPIKILEKVRYNGISYAAKDYIFSAFYSYLFFSREFSEQSKLLIIEPYTGKPNGPGKEFYNYLFEHLYITDRSGYTKAINWWKKPEIKETLNIILERRFGNNKSFSSFIKYLMEE
ncbi:MAG: hypothetical protein BV456_01730 [Thermoplasmata archaeon M8B2D]|nr:MAG: hypothetical protein BV456_01730 [Thermoplasmata archaeon M8B2D]